MNQLLYEVCTYEKDIIFPIKSYRWLKLTVLGQLLCLEGLKQVPEGPGHKENEKKENNSKQFLQTKYLRSNLLGSKGDCLLTTFCQVWCYPLKPGWEWIVDHNLDSLSFCLCSFYYYLVDFLARGEGGKFMSACVTKHYLWNVKKIYIGGPLKWKEFTMIESIWNLSKCKFLSQLLWCVSQVSTSGCRENALLSCIKLVLTQHQRFDLKQQH